MSKLMRSNKRNPHEMEEGLPALEKLEKMETERTLDVEAECRALKEAEDEEEEEEEEDDEEDDGEMRMFTVDDYVAGQSVADFISTKEAKGDFKRVKLDAHVQMFTLNAMDFNTHETVAELCARKEAEEAEKK